MQRNLWKIKSCFSSHPLFSPQCPVIPSAGPSSESRAGCPQHQVSAHSVGSLSGHTTAGRGPGRQREIPLEGARGLASLWAPVSHSAARRACCWGVVSWLCQAVSAGQVGTSEPSRGQRGLVFCPLAQC